MGNKIEPAVENTGPHRFLGLYYHALTCFLAAIPKNPFGILNRL